MKLNQDAISIFSTWDEAARVVTSQRDIHVNSEYLRDDGGNILGGWLWDTVNIDYTTNRGGGKGYTHA